MLHTISELLLSLTPMTMLRKPAGRAASNAVAAQRQIHRHAA
jgi:hypothetical protein